MNERTRFDLRPEDVPTAWFNIMPDLAQKIAPLPPLNPQTKEPIGPADLLPLFPEALIMQEVSTEQWIDIPGPVIDIYRLWRPTPLFRATRTIICPAATTSPGSAPTAVTAPSESAKSSA